MAPSLPNAGSIPSWSQPMTFTTSGTTYQGATWTYDPSPWGLKLTKEALNSFAMLILGRPDRALPAVKDFMGRARAAGYPNPTEQEQIAFLDAVVADGPFVRPRQRLSTSDSIRSFPDPEGPIRVDTTLLDAIQSEIDALKFNEEQFQRKLRMTNQMRYYSNVMGSWPTSPSSPV